MCSFVNLFVTSVIKISTGAWYYLHLSLYVSVFVNTLKYGCNSLPDWAQLSDEQKKETKEFLLMRYSVEDLQLAYDQHFVRKGMNMTQIIL